ncbi:HNH endonuclease signature motif containing protein [Nitrosospira sp. Nl5]|uniref:HNH endonuclease signature motif containing protein n=1 Tax=Nitrosospira sp. Nl5 TaxID=200120 RepID=UPI001C40A451|nr:HNH endonuclease signature motif containing protein [Nitrosospira sp. Nl5]
MATMLGIRKSDAYLASPAACRLRRGDNVGSASRFKKGQSAWNKGIHFDSGGRSAETRFRPGTVPPNHKPAGTTRISKDGYLEIKIAEGMYQWRLLHREIWKEAHGEYPARGTALIFKDGNKQNCNIANLEVLTRKELMLRNSVHNLPEEIKEVIRLNGVIRRKIHGK